MKPMRDDKDGDKDDDKFTTRPDGSKWQNKIDLPDDNDGWVDSINLDEASHPTYHGYPYAGKMFKGAVVEFECEGEKCRMTKEQRAKFNEDFSVMKAAYDEIFKSKFIPWVTKPIKNDEDKKSAEKSMKLYDVIYSIKSGDKGEFDLQYNFSTSEEKNVAVGIYIYVNDGKVSGTHCYEI